nr:hypothetical protein [Desulfobulbus propionicus]
MVDETGRSKPLQTFPLALWPDGSIKWLLVDFFVDLPGNTQRTYTLVRHPEPPPSAFPVVICHQSVESWIVETGTAEFMVNTRILKPFDQVSIGVNSHHRTKAIESSQLCLLDDQGRNLDARIETLVLETCGAVRCTVVACGTMIDAAEKTLGFEARLHFYQGTAQTTIEFRLHNPQAARHFGGLWDLGDPGSFFFKECGFRFTLPRQPMHFSWQMESGDPWYELGPGENWTVYQESSGGDHWNSPNHRNHQGKVPLTFRGYKVLDDQGEVTHGDRAEPVLVCQMDSGAVLSTYISNFWQKFPKSITGGGQELVIGLFPGAFPDLHELQGGEQATNHIWLDCAADPKTAAFGNAMVTVQADEACLIRSAVFKDFSWSKEDTPFSELLREGLEGTRGFYAKREMIDEYGWRHFGELYADHESAQSPDIPFFISHYNNQYDPLYGMYRQYLTSGDERWRQLAADLAAHVADIDINHTNRDREEYNHGLFWHTDHYLDAGTATHRMASREHLLKKNPAFCGGGPGAEHCYTSGLAVHYLLTGDPRFKELVLQLADWCYLSLRGPQTILAALLRALKGAKTLARQQGSPRLWHRFPLTRGTGNCIKSNLDAFDLSGDRRYLDRAASLIRQTVHPCDPLEERDLLNAEVAWSYTVFLAAVGMFLAKKAEWNEYDNAYAHSRESFLHYARWMARHEYPYLDNQVILEFPEVTWAGQDMRKSVLFYFAAGLCDNPEEQSLYLERCRFFLDAAAREMHNSDASLYTRPLALVLQNSWVAGKAGNAPPLADSPGETARNRRPQAPRLTMFTLLKRTARDMGEVLRETNLKREQRWLAARLRDR